MRNIKLSIITLLGILLLVGAACGGGTYQLTTIVDGQGTVSPWSGTYAAGESVTLAASPSYGWIFSHWGGDGSGSQNPTTVTMDSDKTVYAHFMELVIPSPTPTATVDLSFCPTPSEGKANIAGVLTWNGESWYGTFHVGGVLNVKTYGDWLEIAGVTYTSGTVLARDSIDLDGYYCFRNLEPGEYMVSKSCPPGSRELTNVVYGPIPAEANQTYWIPFDPYNVCAGD